MTTPERWWGRLFSITMGWYFAQSYARYPQEYSNGVAILVVTFGVFLVGLACYDWGRGDR